ncbi:related to acyl-CoA dehydrogenase [Phialocephala subalpina]|uniref:Related to acyl-CoA dehydrogenase n=1 Tax=Phialocephala subalpina TaxID=576137 RepID=A0A1L7XLJ5_9HELO|nr:related to acyl-CoA dehydrogenase [Phialocephala subalpina]
MSTISSVPFAEAPWLRGATSPYYNDSHLKWQQKCRNFITENLSQHAVEWEKTGVVPSEVFQKFAAGNFLLPSLPPPLNVNILKSLSRCGLSGIQGSLVTGMAFGVPPLLKFANEELQQDGGSDLSNILTTAEKSKDGGSYIVNGQKKWITNGIWADYGTMLVRTGSAGPSGLSLLLVPLKGHPGVEMRKLAVSGAQTSGTTFIDLDNVIVPISNLIGKEGMGMKYTVTNFNHERISLAITGTVQARVALSSAFAYTMKREAFGKTLLDQPVVRHRIAKCGAELEALWALVEQVVHQLTSPSSADEGEVEIGAMAALAKVQAGRVLDKCVRCAVLLFGGSGYTKSGQGELIEMLSREVHGPRIFGGSEDILLDLAVRQLAKLYVKTSAGSTSRL